MINRILGWMLFGVVSAFVIFSFVKDQSPLIAADEGLTPLRVGSSLCYQGVSSCSAASCHGGGYKGCKGSEQTTFATVDPHSRAYQVLLTERSAQMIRNLKDPQSKPAEKNPLCLACHAINPEATSRAANFSLVDGVGCENCHGPAQKWLTTHYQAEWKTLTPGEKESLGFRNTKDLATRARGCAECHIGHGDVDVNHDLIAAGHPRLNFEFASFHSIYPKHWNEKQDKTRYPDWEARAWNVGQIVSAQTSFELLAHRASAPNKPWPELAEFNCFACHKNLPGSAFEPKVNDPNKLGRLVPNDWYTGMLGQVLPDNQEPHLASLLQGDLAKRRTKKAEIASQANQLAFQLRGQLSQFEQGGCLTSDQIHDRLNRLLAEEGRNRESTWDQQVQRYLGLAAMTHALNDLAPQRQDPKIKEYLLNRQKKLSLPEGQNSPAREN